MRNQGLKASKRKKETKSKKFPVIKNILKIKKEIITIYFTFNG